MLLAPLNDMLAALPNALSAGKRPPTKEDPFAAQMGGLRHDLSTLALACADSLAKTAQYYHGEDSWVIGTMPGYGPLADAVEATARGFLANSHLPAAQTEVVASTLKMSGDLRTAARGARQAVQIAFLFSGSRNGGADALMLLAPLADATVAIAERTAFAVQAGDLSAAHQAAQGYRTLDGLRIQIERGVCGSQWTEYFSPALLKMIRAGAWNFAVAGEGAARVAARLLTLGM